MNQQYNIKFPNINLLDVMGRVVEKHTKHYQTDFFDVDTELLRVAASTVLKMAKKRALVDAVLNVACLSARFTQDVEDMNMEPEQPSGKAPASQQQPPRTDKAASQKQIAYLEKLIQDCGTTAAALNRYVQKNYGVDDYHKITSLMASELIQKFQGAMTR